MFLLKSSITKTGAAAVDQLMRITLFHTVCYVLASRYVATSDNHYHRGEAAVVSVRAFHPLSNLRLLLFAFGLLFSTLPYQKPGHSHNQKPGHSHNLYVVASIQANK